MQDYLTTELSELATYSNNLFGYLQNRLREIEMDSGAWAPESLSLPSFLSAHSGSFDEDDIDILYLCVAMQADDRLPKLAEAVYGIGYACPLLWLQLKAVSHSQGYWMEQFRFSSQRALFKLGLLQYDADAGKGFSLRTALHVAEDVYFAFQGVYSLPRSLQAYAQLYEPSYPLPMPACNMQAVAKLREILVFYLQNAWHARAQAPHLVPSPKALGILLTAKEQYPTHILTAAICRQIGALALYVDIRSLELHSSAQLYELLVGVFSYAQRFGCVVLLDNAEIIQHHEQRWEVALNHCLTNYACACLLMTRSNQRLNEHFTQTLSLRFEVDASISDAPQAALLETANFWDDAIKAYALSPLEPEICALQYPYGANDIWKLAHATRWLHSSETQFQPEDLEKAVEHQAQSMEKVIDTEGLALGDDFEEDGVG